MVLMLAGCKKNRQQVSNNLTLVLSLSDVSG